MSNLCVEEGLQVSFVVLRPTWTLGAPPRRLDIAASSQFSLSSSASNPPPREHRLTHLGYNQSSLKLRSSPYPNVLNAFHVVSSLPF